MITLRINTDCPCCGPLFNAAQELEKSLAEAKERISAAEKLDKLLCFSDHIYTIREREGKGWEGPKVKAYSDALNKFAKKILSARKEGKP